MNSKNLQKTQARKNQSLVMMLRSGLDPRIGKKDERIYVHYKFFKMEISSK